MENNYTSKIILEDIALETNSDGIALQEFGNMQWWWSNKFKTAQSQRVYSRIRNPLNFRIEGDEEGERTRRYYEVMRYLLQHRLASQLSVNSGVKVNGKLRWIEAYKVESDKKIRYMAEVASKDKEKRNYFTMGFKEEGSSWWESATIEFVEYNNQIIGYEIYANMLLIRRHPHLFDIRTNKRYYKWNNALWVPEGYMDLPRPFK